MAINWARVQDLRDEVGTEDLSEIIDVFLEDMTDRLAPLRADPAPQVTASLLHDLKGTAANLGFDGLADLCRRSEHGLAAGQPPDCAALVACFDASVPLLLDGLSGLGVVQG